MEALTTTKTIIEIKGLTKNFPIQRGFWSKTVGYIHAVENINLKIKKGQTLGIVGESGCGKSTLGKLILRLLEPTAGKVLYKGEDLFSLSINDLNRLRQKLQIVFQNPYSSLNPRIQVKDSIAEPILVHKLITDKSKLKNRVEELLNLVGLDNSLGDKYPHELSGGQKQRVAIARAVSLNPEFLVLDEPISALDVSVQAQILNLLLDLQKKLNLTYMFISHNLSVVSYLSDEIAVMYLGHILEHGPKRSIIDAPQNPYTVALLSAAPDISKIKEEAGLLEKRIILSGDIPDPSNPPSGCVFRTRCPIAKEKCSLEEPSLQSVENRDVACHFPGELSLKSQV